MEVDEADVSEDIEEEDYDDAFVTVNEEDGQDESEVSI